MLGSENIAVLRSIKLVLKTLEGREFPNTEKNNLFFNKNKTLELTKGSYVP